MPFILLVLFSAFFIEGIGTYVSVIGLGHLFAMNAVILTLAVALDIGKVTAVSFLYKNWKEINLLMKSYMLAATAVLMLITSTGCFGFLAQQFQNAIVTNNQDTITITALEDEQARLQARKEEIDAQIANMPADYARARRETMAAFAPETDRINARLAELDSEIPNAKVESVKKQADLGPILYVAEAFDITPEEAVKWVILLIIFVFDPLAIVLLIAGNFLIEKRKKTLDIPSSDPPSKPDKTETSKTYDEDAKGDSFDETTNEFGLTQAKVTEWTSDEDDSPSVIGSDIPQKPVMPQNETVVEGALQTKAPPVPEIITMETLKPTKPVPRSSLENVRAGGVEVIGAVDTNNSTARALGYINR